VGPGQIGLAGVAPLDRAGAGELAFLASARYLPYFQRSSAGAVLLSPAFKDVGAGPATRIVVPDVYRALRVVIEDMYPPPAVRWSIHPTARIGRGARWSGRVAVGPYAVVGADVELGPNCTIGAHAEIGDGAQLGEGCRLESHVVVYPGAVIGDRAVLRAGARVGGPGFGYVRTASGHQRLPHVGRCVLGADVEVGANSTLDRGSIDDTVIGDGTKVDNLVQIGHNVRIGERCLIMAQVGIAGSTQVDDDVILAGQAGLAGHLRVGRAARIAAQSGVIGDIGAGETVSGYPARRHHQVLRQAAALARLAPLAGQLERIATRDVPAGR
jgi:UDP-3-O-[3-hydroxymyristoyl] glucosamine N-acyltransferase